jgi:predicted phage gp36 major capsid-like protein
LKSEDEQQAADDDAQSVDWQRGQRGAQGGCDRGQNERRRANAGQARTPAARHPHCQHDRERFDRLHRTGEKDGDRKAELWAGHGTRVSSSGARAARRNVSATVGRAVLNPAIEGGQKQVAGLSTATVHFPEPLLLGGRILRG